MLVIGIHGCLFWPARGDGPGPRSLWAAPGGDLCATATSTRESCDSFLSERPWEAPVLGVAIIQAEALRAVAGA